VSNFDDLTISLYKTQNQQLIIKKLVSIIKKKYLIIKKNYKKISNEKLSLKKIIYYHKKISNIIKKISNENSSLKKLS